MSRFLRPTGEEILTGKGSCRDEQTVGDFIGIAEGHFRMVVIDTSVLDQLQVFETRQRSRYAKKMLGGLDKTGVGAPSPMMVEVEHAGFVIVDKGCGIVGLEPPEVVPSRKNEQVPGEAIPTDVRDLPGPIG